MSCAYIRNLLYYVMRCVPSGIGDLVIESSVFGVAATTTTIPYTQIEKKLYTMRKQTSMHKDDHNRRV